MKIMNQLNLIVKSCSILLSELKDLWQLVVDLENPFFKRGAQFVMLFLTGLSPFLYVYDIYKT